MRQNWFVGFSREITVFVSVSQPLSEETPTDPLEGMTSRDDSSRVCHDLEEPGVPDSSSGNSRVLQEYTSQRSSREKQFRKFDSRIICALPCPVEIHSTSQLLQRRRRRGVCLPSTSGTAERVHKHTQGKGRRLLLSPLVSLTLFTTIFILEYNPHNYMAGHI